MPVSRQKWILAFTVAVAAVVLLVLVYLLLTPEMLSQKDPSQPFGFQVFVKGRGEVGKPNLVIGYLWSNRGTEVNKAEIRHKAKGEEAFHTTPMQRLGAGIAWVGELPPGSISERIFWYITLQDDRGETLNIPVMAPKQLLSTRFGREVNPYVLAVHTILLVGGLVFLFHTLYFSLLILFGRMGELSQNVTTNKAHQSLRWGWLSYFLGAVPLGMYVASSAYGVSNFWSGWPFGTDIKDTRAEILLIYFGIAILLRKDQFRFVPSVKRTGRISNRAFAWLIVIGIALAALLYVLPRWM